MQELLLSAHVIVRNAERYDYPFREACRSVLPVCDELIILCEETGDATEAWCAELAGEEPGKVRLFVEPWWNPDRGCDCLADATNRCVERCRGRYHFYFQADEVLHEGERDVLRRVAEEGRADYARLRRFNFLSSFSLHSDAVVQGEVNRMGRRAAYPGLRATGDALELGVDDGYAGPEMEKADLLGSVRLYHYGFVRRPRALIEKQRQMFPLYGWPEDPRMDRVVADGALDWFEFVPEPRLTPLEGTHPAVMGAWIAERRHEVENGLVR